MDRWHPRPGASDGLALRIGHNESVTDAYAAAGVDTHQADAGVAAIVSVLKTIETGRASLSVPLPGHYASVMRLPGALAPNLGIALATDSVGSKVIVAEQTGRFDTIGIDCVAMNVNDLICVGAEPLALLDYIAVEQAEPSLLAAIGRGLAVGAAEAGIEIPGGEVCQVPEVLRGHPSPYGFDLVGSAFGVVELDAIIDGSAARPGDAMIGLPASGIHSNGMTLARRALLDDGRLTLDARPDLLGGQSVADVLLEPTVIYVRAILALISSVIEVRGLGAHHRRRAPEPAPDRHGRRLLDHRAVALPSGVRADRLPRRDLGGRDVGGLQHGLRLCRDGAGRPGLSGRRVALELPPGNGCDRSAHRRGGRDRAAPDGHPRGGRQRHADPVLTAGLPEHARLVPQ